MATAAKSISANPIGMEPGPVPLPGAAELFAAMVAGVGGDDSPGEGAAPEAATDEPGETPEAQIDASVLLPMLDQQRAAVPAGKLVGPALDAPAPAIVKIATSGGAQTDPAPVAEAIGEQAKVTEISGRDGLRPTLIDGKNDVPVAVAPEAAKADASPVMRPLKSGKAPTPAADPAPVMRPIDGGKAAPAPITDATPVMRPTTKSTAATVTGSAPAMPSVKPDVAKAGDPEAAIPATNSDAPAASNSKPIQPTPPVQVEAKAAAALAVPAMQAQPVAAASQPKPVAKSIDPKVPTPEVQAAALEGQAGPVAAKERATRAPVAPVELRAEPGSPDTIVAATVTETRTAVQPLHAAPALVQPLAAPVAAPVQNVAAALSQQVLDMSGGDAWIDQIARDISQTAGKDGTMRFRLAPETLGELKVEITHSERGAHVRLNVGSESAQQALVAAEHRLAAEARAQGVRIAETEINFTGGQGQSRDASAFAREQGQQQAQASHQPRTPRGTHANTFTSSAAAPEGRGRTDRYA